jgi:DNA-binding transcriptional MocR family regulator
VRITDLLSNWQAGPGPLYARLAEALTRAISTAELLPGTKLPSERRLASVLGISRATVTQAYEHLRRGGWIESRMGSGSLVRPARGGSSVPGTPEARPISGGIFFNRLLEGGPEALIDMSLASLPRRRDIIGSGMDMDLDSLLSAVPDHGYAPLGLPLLRRLVAAQYSRIGIPTDERQILVTSGAQQALHLIASSYLKPGDRTVVEDPTYPGAIDVFSTGGSRLLPVAMGPEGVRIDLLEKAVEASKPRLVYLMPTYHNPVGTVMPEEARRQIVRMADRSGVPLVEDNTLADISLSTSPPPPPLAAFGASNIITVGSMSKLYWAGLRVGWIRASEATIVRLAQLKAVADLGSSLVSQAIACRLLPEAEAVKAMRLGELLPRLDLLEELLKDQLPTWSWNRPKGGLSLWVRTAGADGSTFAQLALSHGVAISPGITLSPDGAHRDFIRLCFVVESDLIEPAVQRLAAAWRSYWRSGEPQNSQVEVRV